MLITIISLPWIPKSNRGFILPVKLITLSIFISLFMAYYSWNQGFSHSILASLPYFAWFFFFFLMQSKISIVNVEKIIIVFGILYVILYFYQFIIYPTVLFSSKDELDQSRGIQRIVFPGGGVFFFLVFMALSKIKAGAKNYWFWLIIIVLGIVIPFMQATRQYIVVVLLIYIFHFTKGKNIVSRLLIIGVFMGGTMLLLNSNNKILEGIQQEQEKNMEQGSEYIRILTGKYYIFDFSPNKISHVLGNGVPYGIKSKYGKYVTHIKEKFHFHYNDVGLIAIYAFFGILGVIGYILLGIKSITIPLPHKYFYLKYYLWFLFLTSLTSSLLYSYHFLIVNVFVVYCYQLVLGNSQKREQEISSKSNFKI